jgi:hypothetical protein
VFFWAGEFVGGGLQNIELKDFFKGRYKTLVFKPKNYDL